MVGCWPLKKYLVLWTFDIVTAMLNSEWCPDFCPCQSDPLKGPRNIANRAKAIQSRIKDGWDRFLIPPAKGWEYFAYRHHHMFHRRCHFLFLNTLIPVASCMLASSSSYMTLNECSVSLQASCTCTILARSFPPALILVVCLRICASSQARMCQILSSLILLLLFVFVPKTRSRLD